MRWPGIGGRTPLWAYAEVNPASLELFNGDPDEEVTFVPLEAVWPDGKIDLSGRIVKSSASASYTPFHSGDILVPKVSPTFTHGRVAIAPTETRAGLATSEVHVVRARPGVDARWLTYVLRTRDFLDEGTASLQGVAGLKRISARQVGEFGVPTTEPADQRRIADYLDAETAQIDGMLAELDVLIDKVGAHDTARRREVRGDISGPTASLGMVARLIGGVGFPVKYQGRAANGHPFLKVSSLSELDAAGCVCDESNIVDDATAAILGARLVPAGSVLFAKVGAGLLLGRFLLSARDSYMDNNVGALVVNRTYAEPQYLAEHLRAVPMSTLVHPGPLPALNTSALMNLKIPMPSLERQREICGDLAQVSADSAAMIADANRLKELLIERRAALITDVITGKKEVA